MFESIPQDRKVRQFSLSPLFLSEFEGKQPNWGPVGYFTFKRCVDVALPVLCDDLQWRPAGDLLVGQGIVGFDAEVPKGRGKFRHLQHGVVLHNKVERAPTFGVELEDGTVLYATPDHGWLVKLSATDNRLYWRETKDLAETSKGGVAHLLRPFGPMWAKDKSYEAGFLSAAFDGEGCLDRNNGVQFIQVGNPMLQQVETFLRQKEVPFTKAFRKGVKGRQQVFTLRVQGRKNFYSLLGALQPPRLIAKFTDRLKTKSGGALRTSPEDYIKVVRVFDAGERDIAVLSTSTETHFTGGFASHNTYARPTCDCEDPRSCGHPSEEFFETCRRVVEGVYNVQKAHCRRLSLPWNEPKAQVSAQEMFTRMWQFKWTPPGRGLWMMGTPFVAQKGGACINNCAFVSSEHIDEDFAGPFTFLMDMSMLGVGVGGDTRGVGKVKIQTPKMGDAFVVEDSREGWVALARTVINSFVGKGTFPTVIDFSKVRPKGRRIRGFGGTASGPGPLAKLVKNVARTLAPEGVTVSFEEAFHPETDEVAFVQTFFKGEGKPYKITSGGITDVFNMVGACVVAGGVRRCIPKGTLVHTSEGLIPIEKVSVGSSVMTSQGYSTVTAWMDQGVQPVSRITTQMGVFEATDKHEVAVISDTKGAYGWKRLHELEPGDRMVFVDHPLEGRVTTLPPFTYTNPPSSTTCKDIIIPPLTPDVAWLMGLFTGDGYVRLTDNSGEVSITVAEDQAEIKDKAVSVLSMFGVHVSVADPVDGNRCYKVRVKSKQLAVYFSQFKKAKTPLMLPLFVLLGKPEIRAAYVAGLSDADGSFKTSPMLVACSVYPDYMEQVQAVLASLGIPSRMTLHRNATGTWQPLFHLTVVGSKAVKQFTRRVAPYILKFEDPRETNRSGNDYGFPSEMALADGVSGWKEGRMAWSRYTQQITVSKLEELTDRTVKLVPVEVRDIEHGVREDATYDITVDAGEFVVQGGYLVHNSAEIMFGQADDKEFCTLKDPSTLIPMTQELSRLQADMSMVSDQAVLNQMALDITALEQQIEEHPLRSHRWASNNSLFGQVGQDYAEVAQSIAKNGEPGLLWLKNAQDFGRMKDPPNFKDRRAQGANPCFAGDTLIAVADGRGAVPIRQLVEEGNDVPVYSVNPDGHVEIKMARRPRMTKEFSPLVEIELDDGTTFKVTPDHKMRLLDGTKCEAKDLQSGDSLPRFTKRPEAVKKGGPKYLRVYCDTLDSTKDKVFEHRLVAQFHDPETWHDIYDEAQQSGWIKGGLVVHHKDYNPLNNSPENLAIMTFQDHAALHGQVDNAGEKNPMWGKTHTAQTRQKIGRKTSERCSDPVFLAKLAASHLAAERAEASERLTERRRQEFLAYYKEQEARTDLDTVWMEGRLHAVKTCETCQEEFIVPWRVRGQCYCNHACLNKAESHVQARKAGQAVAFADKQRQTLHDQVRVFKDLEALSGTAPRRKDWEDQCRQEGVPSRFRKTGTTENPHVLFGFDHLQQVAADYNHRVVAIRHLQVGEPVFNLSVEDNHTVGVVTTFDPTTKACSGIFAFQCVEQTLESFELCTLVETYPAHHDSYEDFQKTLKVAYLYAKTVTLIPTHDPRTNAVMNRNRRIGCSMSGIRQAIDKTGRREFLNWCDKGYSYIQGLDCIYSEWLGIPLSIKTTSVKPSGTVSLLCGATPGIHPPHSPFYIRNIRVAGTSPLCQAARDAGYKVEKDACVDDTWVISFPVATHCTKGKRDVSIWEQAALAADLQRYWTDNQVSVTVTFTQAEAPEIATVLEVFEDRLKSISFLPAGEDHGYIQAPYIEITEDEYNAMAAKIRPMVMDAAKTEETDNFCTTDTCMLKTELSSQNRR